jgi:hypothetical protein
VKSLDFRDNHPEQIESGVTTGFVRRSIDTGAWKSTLCGVGVV